jgi:hypothetical protein
LQALIEAIEATEAHLPTGAPDAPLKTLRSLLATMKPARPIAGARPVLQQHALFRGREGLANGDPPLYPR